MPSRRSTGMSSGFCTSSASEHDAANRSRPYTSARFGERVVGQGVQAVDGVHDHRDAGGPGGEAAVEPRLRVVGVDEVGSLGGEEGAQLGEGTQVLAGGHGPGGVGEREVADAAPLERVDVRPGRRGAQHLVAGGGEGLELGTEEPVEAHVGGGDVDQLRPSRPPPLGRGAHRVAPAYRRRLSTSRTRSSNHMPPATFRRNQRMPSLTWMGERANR